jgi:hypothetical protein
MSHLDPLSEAGIEVVNAASVARGCAQWRKFDRLVEPY